MHGTFHQVKKLNTLDSGYTFDHYLKDRSGLDRYVTETVELIQTQYGTRVKRIYCDNEFMTNVIADTCKARGIVLSPSPPHEKNFQANYIKKASKSINNFMNKLNN